MFPRHAKAVDPPGHRPGPHGCSRRGPRPGQYPDDPPLRRFVLPPGPQDAAGAHQQHQDQILYFITKDYIHHMPTRRTGSRKLALAPNCAGTKFACRSHRHDGRSSVALPTDVTRTTPGGLHDQHRRHRFPLRTYSDTRKSIRDKDFASMELRIINRRFHLCNTPGWHSSSCLAGTSLPKCFSSSRTRATPAATVSPTSWSSGDSSLTWAELRGSST